MSEPLKAAEQIQLIGLVRKATGQTLRVPCNNDSAGWIEELHMAIAGPYKKLSDPEGTGIGIERQRMGQDWSRIKIT